jgi:hypothetical protein
VEIVVLLSDIVHRKAKCFLPNKVDKSNLAKSTVLPKKESSLRRCYFPAIKLY